MALSGNRKNGEEPRESKVQDRVAKGIAGFLLAIQNRFACFMSAMVNKLTIQSKQACLVVFCLVFGGFSIYAFVGAFRDSESSAKRLKPDQVAVPKYYDRTESEINEPSVSERDIIRINRFKKYMDSLKKTASGRPVYDSILKTRPGLMDSIQVIEQLYYSQSK